MSKQTNQTSKPRGKKPKARKATTLWKAYDTWNGRHSHLGIVGAPDVDSAIAIARRNWPDHNSQIGVRPERESARRLKRLWARAERDLRATAFREAARAVVFHRLGYRVTWITTSPYIPPLTSSTDASIAQIGHTRVVGIPTGDKLKQPESQIDAANCGLVLLAVAFAETHPSGGRSTSRKRANVRAARALVAHPSDACSRRTLTRLNDRAKWMVASDFDEIEAVARELMQDGEMGGETFRVAMAFREFGSLCKQWLLGNPFRDVAQSRPGRFPFVPRF